MSKGKLALECLKKLTDKASYAWDGATIFHPRLPRTLTQYCLRFSKMSMLFGTVFGGLYGIREGGKSSLNRQEARNGLQTVGDFFIEVPKHCAENAFIGFGFGALVGTMPLWGPAAGLYRALTREKLPDSQLQNAFADSLIPTKGESKE